MRTVSGRRVLPRGGRWTFDNRRRRQTQRGNSRGTMSDSFFSPPQSPAPPGVPLPERIALVHDWLPEVGGAERVLGEMLQVLPQAHVYSLVDFIPESERAFLCGKKVRTSFLQNLPGARRFYRSYLPLMPLAIEHFDLAAYDLVLSSSYAVAKGVITGPDQLHLCYCHSPPRYAWDLQELYLRQSQRSSGVKGFLARALLHYIRLWDCRTPNGVDAFAANSRFIQRRIWKVYRRRSRLIYPPVHMAEEGGAREEGRGAHGPAPIAVPTVGGGGAAERQPLGFGATDG